MHINFFKSFLFISILTIFISCFSIFVADGNVNIVPVQAVTKVLTVATSVESFLWPVPGYKRISSNFGRRKAPTNGASTNHSGIDIPAPAGTNLVAISDGVVSNIFWGGAGGFTITINFGEITASYCHISPNFLVSVNDYISKGDVIAQVGPKNVYNVPNNPYKDKNGNPTNGATTGPHLHFTVRKNKQLINPINLY